MKLSRHGFTLVELIVVIVVIGILSTITVVGFGRYQADSRDARRVASIVTIAESLEKYYDENGEYPSCSTITDTGLTVSTSILQGVSQAALVAPQAASGTTNSIECSQLTINGDDFFEYVGDGSTACTSGSACLNYTLRYKEESTGTIKELTSRRNTSIATSGAPVLSVGSAGFSQISLSWTSVPNATSYLVQRATNAGFSDNLDEASFTNTSGAMTGLDSNTSYYFRVRPNATSSTGNWSNTVVADTLNLEEPTVVATADSNSQITVSWNVITNATSYSMDYSVNPDLSSPVSSSGITTTAQTITGLDTGKTYYFRVKALNGSNESAWSSIVNATTFVPAPTSITATTNSSTQITANWSSVSVADTYTLQYDQDSSFGSPAEVTGLTSTSYAATGLTQGEKYYFRVYALVNTTSSDASPVANATTTVNTPGSPSITAYRPGAVRPYSAGWWIAWIDTPAGGNWYYAYANASASCPSGTSKHYQFSARYNSPSTTYTTGDTTGSTWYMVQPASGYKIKFGARAYCKGSDANSSWSGWRYSCAANPGSTTSCTF